MAYAETTSKTAPVTTPPKKILSQGRFSGFAIGTSKSGKKTLPGAIAATKGELAKI